MRYEDARKFRENFYWLAQRPKRNFTLTELFQHHVLHRPLPVINANPLGFSRAARVWDRVQTTFGIAALGAMAVSGALLPGLAVLALSKASGIVGGKMVDNLLRVEPGKMVGFSLLPRITEDWNESKRLLTEAREEAGWTKKPKPPGSKHISL